MHFISAPKLSKLNLKNINYLTESLAGKTMKEQEAGKAGLNMKCYFHTDYIPYFITPTNNWVHSNACLLYLQIHYSIFSSPISI